MDIEGIYIEYGLDICPQGHKHYREGWINVECPFCTGNPGYHLGFNLQNQYFKCWRCGWHSIESSLQALLNKERWEIQQIIKEFGGKYKKVVLPFKKDKPKKIERVVFPTGTHPLEKRHKKYLRGRKYSPNKLEKKWDIKGTGPIALWEGSSYANRIIIPIYWEDKLVSFESRDITGKRPDKYKACPKKGEIIDHKNIIYKHPNYFGKIGICVEGIFDVWRMEEVAFATFGIEFTPSQLSIISQLYNKVYIMYDDDPQAIVQGKKLKAELLLRGVWAEQIIIKGDPADFSEEEKGYWVNKIFTGN